MLLYIWAILPYKEVELNGCFCSDAMKSALNLLTQKALGLDLLILQKR